MFIGTADIELRVFKTKEKKNMDKMGKIFVLIIFTFGAFFTEIFGILFRFHVQ